MQAFSAPHIRTTHKTEACRFQKDEARDGSARYSTTQHSPMVLALAPAATPAPASLILPSLPSTPSPSSFSRQINHIGDSVACKRAPAPGPCQECQAIPAVARRGDEEICSHSSEPCENQTEGIKEDDSIEQRTDVQIHPLFPPSHSISWSVILLLINVCSLYFRFLYSLYVFYSYVHLYIRFFVSKKALDEVLRITWSAFNRWYLLSGWLRRQNLKPMAFPSFKRSTASVYVFNRREQYQPNTYLHSSRCTMRIGEMLCTTYLKFCSI